MKVTFVFASVRPLYGRQLICIAPSGMLTITGDIWTSTSGYTVARYATAPTRFYFYVVQVTVNLMLLILLVSRLNVHMCQMSHICFILFFYYTETINCLDF